MADFFVSYTDSAWAFWIAQELARLGHTPHVYEWEISAGGNIPAWMEERHDAADHILFVISKLYLTKEYSNWERQAAQWAAASQRPNFALPVFVEECDAPTLLAPFTYCKLYGLSEVDARTALANYLAPATKPAGPVKFPGAAGAMRKPLALSTAIAFPGSTPPPVISPVTRPAAEIANAHGAFSADQLGKTMANPRYTDDFSRLDRVYDRRAIINMESVMIVTGNRNPG